MVSINQQVLCLQVSVQDILRMNVTERDGYLNKKTYNFILRNVFVFSSLNVIEQSATSNIFHDNNNRS